MINNPFEGRVGPRHTPTNLRLVPVTSIKSHKSLSDGDKWAIRTAYMKPVK